MRSLQDHLGEFETRGVRLVAISVDRPEITRFNCQNLGFTYTFLSDFNREVIRQYDLVHVRGAGRRGDIARPAEFLIDSNGIVRWRNLTGDYRIRARPEQILTAVQ